MKIVYQDANFVAVDKSPGWLAVPGRDPQDARPILGRELEKHLGASIFPVHRLDAEVSGLVLYALNPEAHREANAQFENRTVQKTYQAFSAGGIFESGQQGEWKAKILRGKKRAYESPGGKLAVTRFQVVGQDARGYFEWRLFPKTGRSHQLRWELYRHDSPILGDSLYGSEQSWTGGGIALRSLQLAFDESFRQAWRLPSTLEVPGFSPS